MHVYIYVYIEVTPHINNVRARAHTHEFFLNLHPASLPRLSSMYIYLHKQVHANICMCDGTYTRIHDIHIHARIVPKNTPSLAIGCLWQLTPFQPANSK